MTFSEKVKAVRAQFKLTQEELAHELGVSFATVNRWESGSFKPSKMGYKMFSEYCKTKDINFGD